MPFDGLRLRELRSRRALTLRELGARSGVGYDTIHRPRDRQAPAAGPSTVRKLADASTWRPTCSFPMTRATRVKPRPDLARHAASGRLFHPPVSRRVRTPQRIHDGDEATGARRALDRSSEKRWAMGGRADPPERQAEIPLRQDPQGSRRQTPRGAAESRRRRKPQDAAVTVAASVDKWLSASAKPSVDCPHLRGCAPMVRVRIVPRIGAQETCKAHGAGRPGALRRSCSVWVVGALGWSYPPLPTLRA